MEQYTVIHDRTNANEHPLAGNPNIYTAKVENNEQYELTPENYTVGYTAVPEKVPDIMAYLYTARPDYVFDEAVSNYGDITVY
jgi:hypothetical protein